MARSTIDLSRLAAIEGARDRARTMCAEAQRNVERLGREHADARREIEHLSAQQPRDLEEGAIKKARLDDRCQRADQLGDDLRKARAVQADCDERYQAAMRLFENCQKFARETAT